MKIIVAIKQVPAREAPLRVNAKGRLDETGLLFEMNGPDAYALEAGLQLRDKLGGEVVVLSAGPERVAQTIREALAKGADRGIHVSLSGKQQDEPFVVAQAIAAAVAEEAPHLLLTGLQSEDACSGQTGVIVAELLGCAHATIVTEIASTADGIRVKREGENGWNQYVSLPLPAVLTIQSGSTKPRLATMLGIKQAKTKEIRQAKPPKSQGNGDALGTLTERIYVPVREKKAKILAGDARECARQLVEQLSGEARIL